MKYALKFQHTGNSKHKSGQWAWLREFGLYGENNLTPCVRGVFSGNDLMLFDSHATAVSEVNEVMIRQKKWVCDFKLTGNYKIVQVEPVYQKIVKGYKTIKDLT